MTRGADQRREIDLESRLSRLDLIQPEPDGSRELEQQF